MSSTATINKSNVEDILNLSSIQKGILYYYLSKPDSSAYIAQLSLNLNGNINVSLLQEACRIVTNNNEMLRTVFRWEGLSNPVQIVYKDYEIPFKVYDLVNDSNIDRLIPEGKLIEKNRIRKIDISQHPIEITIYRIDTERYEMLITWHHIVYDGWSNAIFIRELLSTYSKLEEGIVPNIKRKGKYKDFIKWCSRQEEHQQENYWKTYFKNFTTKTPVPVDKDRNKGKSSKKGCYSFSLQEDILKIVYEFISQKGITLSVLMYCAWTILLNKFIGVRDIVFGVTVSVRNTGIEGIDNMIGLFINTLPLRTVIDHETKICDILYKINLQKKSWIPYESTDLAKIKTYSGIDAKESLFDSMVVVENYPIMVEKWLSSDTNGVTIESFEMLEKTEFSLALAVLLPNNNVFTLQYDTELFSDGFIEKIAEYYLYIINVIVTDSDKLVSDLELLLDKEKEKMLAEIEVTQSNIAISFDF